MVIRSLQLADYVAVSNLLKETLTEESFEKTRKVFVNQLLLENHLIVVALINGQIVGLAIGTIEQQRGIIYRVVVKSIYRQQGIGKSLLQTLHYRFTHRKITEIVVALDSYNKNVWTFYEAAGFHNKVIDWK